MNNKKTCPVCKSENTKDESRREDNGVIGTGYTSWVVEEKHLCNDCGVYFKPVDVFNKKKSEDTINTLRSFLNMQHQTVMLNLQIAKDGLIQSSDTGKDWNGISTAEWGTEVTRNKTELDFINFLYTGFPELKPSK